MWGYPKKKNTRAARVRRLKAKVKKLEKQKALRSEEAQLKKKYETLKRNF